MRLKRRSCGRRRRRLLPRGSHLKDNSGTFSASTCLGINPNPSLAVRSIAMRTLVRPTENSCTQIIVLQRASCAFPTFSECPLPPVDQVDSASMSLPARHAVGIGCPKRLSRPPSASALSSKLLPDLSASHHSIASFYFTLPPSAAEVVPPRLDLRSLAWYTLKSRTLSNSEGDRRAFQAALRRTPTSMCPCAAQCYGSSCLAASRNCSRRSFPSRMYRLARSARSWE